MKAGLAVLAAHPRVDPGRVAALGLCLGGDGVLDLARSGADLGGVVSLHGHPDTPDPPDAKDIQESVPVPRGTNNPHVPMAQVTAFMDEMRSARVGWQLVAHGRAVHAFSDPAAGSSPAGGAAYDEKEARRSFAAASSFLEEVPGG